MIHYLIIDDEPIAHRIIENYCDNLQHLEKKGSCYNAFEALQFLNENTVDLLFLDIKMPGLNGVDFMKSIKTVFWLCICAIGCSFLAGVMVQWLT